MSQAEVWQDPQLAQKLGKERADLEKTLLPLQKIITNSSEYEEFLHLALAEEDAATLAEIATEVTKLLTTLESLEFRRMFSQTADEKNAFLDIHSGSGGTEAQDWAEMLLRMFLRFCEKQGFQTQLLEVSAGDVAGIKSATILIKGEYAFGWLKTETGIHRLVRKSPFDSNNKRHTSFASVFVAPELEDEDFEIEINPADLRIDVYRASGAGGQHVNKTESAVRITHIPTNTVAASQAQRSQHANKDTAMKQLKAKLWEMEMQKRNEEKQRQENAKADIGWGSQIRSYVLDDGRIKDLRTGVENFNTQGVLDGDLLEFIQASLKLGIR